MAKEICEQKDIRPKEHNIIISYSMFFTLRVQKKCRTKIIMICDIIPDASEVQTELEIDSGDCNEKRIGEYVRKLVAFPPLSPKTSPPYYA